MFQTKVVEKIKTRVPCSVTFFFFENHAFYEIMWKNTAERDSPQMTIWRLNVTLKLRCLYCLPLLTSSLNKIHLNLSVTRNHELDLRFIPLSVKATMHGVVSPFPLYVLVCCSGTNTSLFWE